jgi:hypothetical protein
VAPEVAAELADFRPTVDGAVRWVANYEEGRSLARASGLPMLVYLHFPACPMCIELDRRTFADGAVQERAAAFVPLRIDVREAPEEYEPRLRRGWPYMAAVDADGQVIEEFPGEMRAAVLAKRLGDAADAAERRSARPDWSEVRAATTALRRGDDARGAGRLGEAHTAYSDAASRNAGLVSRVAATAELALRREALALLRGAEDAVRSDAEEAADRLGEAALKYAGSPLGDDLGLVAAAIRDSGVFPVLKETHR